MIFLFSLFIAFFAIWRGIIPQKIALKWKIIAGVISAMITFKFYIFSLASGKLFSAPQWNPAILLVFTWLYALIIFFVIFLLIYELLRLAAKAVTHIRKKELPGFFTNPLWRLTALLPAALLVTCGMYEGLKIPEVTKYEIKFPALPSELDGFTIAHLSDIHADPFTRKEKIEKIVELTNKQNADIIVITGDFVDGKTNQRGDDLSVLKNLSAPCGVFGVPGNHEYYSGYSDWMNFLQNGGIDMLENRHIIIRKKLTLAGVTDYSAKKIRGKRPDIIKAFAGSPEANFRILLAHQPKLAQQAAQNGINLQLSGHTHGGMIYGMDILVSMFNNGLVSGIYNINDMTLFIPNGTGIWNGFPLRLGRHSEIAIITLRKDTGR